MIDILNKYLFQHSSINVPGLGTIFIEKVSARTDFVNKQIFPPEYIFRFDKYYDTPGKDFFTYLSSCKNIPDYEAIQLYNQFALEIRSKIKLEEKAEWKDVGLFRKNSSGDIELEQLPVYQRLYAPVIAERVFRSDTSHAILVGDREKTNFEMTKLLNQDNQQRQVKKVKKVKKQQVKKQVWLIYAVILFIVTLMVLIFHFNRYGMSLESISNRQPIELNPPRQ